MTTKPNIFDDFSSIADNSEGLKTLAQTEISIIEEPRKTNIITVTTATEAQSIRNLCSELSVEMGKRITVSNMGREYFLMLLGQPPSDTALHDMIYKRISK